MIYPPVNLDGPSPHDVNPWLPPPEHHQSFGTRQPRDEDENKHIAKRVRRQKPPQQTPPRPPPRPPRLHRTPRVHPAAAAAAPDGEPPRPVAAQFQVDD